MTGIPSAQAATVRCPACSTVAVPGLPFCPQCGSRLNAARGNACSTCATPVVAGAKFCAACGRSLTGAVAPRASTPSTRAMLSLIDESAQVVKQFPLTRDETTIGRQDADIAFAEDTFLSPLHAQISVRESVWTVRDLGSRNGTWVFTPEPHRLLDGDLMLVGSQIIRFRRLGYPGPHPPERDATRRMGSLIPSADIACLTQLRADGSVRDVVHLSPGRHVTIGRDRGDWLFPYDPSMSATHAQVRSEDADFVLVDAGSRNGVAVAARGDVTLVDGSRVLAGDKMLRVELK